MRASRTPWIVLALLGATAAHAADATLVEAWQGVVAHSPEYAAALARRDAGAAAREAARAVWMPSLMAQGGLAQRTFESETRGAQFAAPGFGSSTGVDFRTSVNGGHGTQWALMAQQPLLDAGRSADAATARARARMADEQFRQTEQALMVRTAAALAAVVESDAQLQAVRRQRAAAERSRDMAQERYAAGDLPVTEWREAQAQADLLRVQELDASQAAAVANESYSNLTGLAPPPSPAVDVPGPGAEVAGEPVVGQAGSRAGAQPLAALNEWLERARRQSPSLALQREQTAVADAELRRYSVTDGLQVNIVGQYGRDVLSGSGDYGSASASQRVAAIGLQVSMPLFTGGMRSAQRHAATAAVRAARADAEGAEKQIDLQVRAAWLAAGNARARLDATLRALASADSRLDATRIGRETGDRTLLDLMAAEGFALQARAGAVAARCEGLLATLRLEAAAGTLSEQTLRDAASGEFSCGPLPAR